MYLSIYLSLSCDERQIRLFVSRRRDKFLPDAPQEVFLGQESMSVLELRVFGLRA